MSGLFRYNSNITPTRRSTLSPFCISGQDATMDNSYSFGYRSPTSININAGVNGTTSPSQGRSLREYDEKLHALQKENFNLKLRLFFLEEKTPATNGAGGSSKSTEDESLFKKNVDLKVENEELRKELQEKQDLLCQAAKAMELMEESQRKSHDKSSMTISDLSQKIQYLEEEIRSTEKSNYSSQSHSGSTASCIFSRSALAGHQEIDLKAKIIELEQTIDENEKKIEKLTDELNAAQTQINENNEIIKQHENHSDEMAYKLAELKEGLNSTDGFSTETDDICELKKQILVQKQTIADNQCSIQDLEEKLSAKGRAHDKGCKTIQLLLIKTKELDAEIEQLKLKDPKSNAIAELNSLKAELIRAQNDTEQANRWRKECADVCAVLTIRLKELAGFLDTLLKNKDVLSVLAQDRHKAMRKAVDRSLDLSRSLNMSISINPGRPSINEKSLMQISSLTELLNDSYFGESFNHIQDDKEKNLNKDASIIESLRAEVKSLKTELEKVNAETGNNGSSGSLENIRRDRSSRNLLPNFAHNSESEAWSEPDRKVSHERIGLDDPVKLNTHVRSPCSAKYKGGDASSSASDDNNNSRLIRKNSVLRLQEKIIELETQLSAKNSELLNIQNDAILADNIQSEESEKLTAITNELEQCRNQNKSLQDSLNELKKGYAALDREYENQNDKAMLEHKKLRDELENEKNLLKKEISKLNEVHASQIDAMISQESVKFELLRQQLNDKFNKDLAEEMRMHKEQMSHDWVSRVKYEKQTQQYHELERRLGDSETLLQLMRDNETAIGAQIMEKEKNIRALKRNLDEITLQTSKAVLERTKFMNERDQFEKISRELQEKCDILALDKSELHSKLAKLAHNNAQLHNKLVVNETQFQLTRSASQGNARYGLASVNCLTGTSSGGDQSGYTSDELKQRLENSSPDLGIDSDGTGRSSGNDLNTIRSSELKVLNSPKLNFNHSFTNNLLEDDEDNDLPSPHKSPIRSTPIPIIIQHDCEKVEKENAELQRKLERTRRAFEKTWAQLRISNQRKEQIEKDIRQEIYKTHSVLKNVRSNMESVGQQTPNKSLKMIGNTSSVTPK